MVKFLGKTLRPEAVKFVKALPKTRSAKIVRGTIRKRYLNLPLGDLASSRIPIRSRRSPGRSKAPFPGTQFRTSPPTRKAFRL